MLNISLVILEAVHIHTHGILLKEQYSRKANLIKNVNGRPLFSNNPNWMAIK